MHAGDVPLGAPAHFDAIRAGTVRGQVTWFRRSSRGAKDRRVLQSGHREWAALFPAQLGSVLQLVPVQVDDVLGELAPASLVTSDGYPALRALLGGKVRKARHTPRRRRPAPAHPTGRWKGEQYALPEVIPLLRSAAEDPDEKPLILPATDPLNLTGRITPGPRVPALPGQSIALTEGQVKGHKPALSGALAPPVTEDGSAGRHNGQPVP